MSPTSRSRAARLALASALSAALCPAPLAAQHDDRAAASTCRALGPIRSAVDACRQAVRREPSDAGLRVRLADALVAAGEEGAALDAYRDATRLAPDSAAAWFGAARVLDRRGDRRGALRHYQEFARRTPHEAAGAEISGWLLLELHRPAEALAAFEDALARDAGSAGGAYGAGVALAALGRSADAARALADALRLAPGNADAWGALARVTAALGKEREAVANWERARAIDAGYFAGRSDERRQWERLVRRAGPQPPSNAPTPAAVAVRAAPATRPTPVGGRPVEPVLVARVSLRDSVPRVIPAGPRVRRAGAFATGTTGSGFVVSARGHVLTNRHVVRGCAAVRVRPEGTQPRPATVVAIDGDDDLALLRTDTTFREVAAFRGGREPRAGEDVVAIGYPLNGLLADQPHVTIGTISALAGLYNDLHEMTISTPVQPGNSGGPLLDGYGTVVGVVVTKLNARMVAEETGDLPQNVNFAIKSAVAREFLAGHGIAPMTGLPTTRLSNADVGDVGRSVTVLVECVR
jgi:S1-C subfamily serine protease